MTSPLLAGLTLAAVSGPLLTFTRLWQVKEWRIDRLREHLLAEGPVRVLWGTARVSVALLLQLLALALHAAMQSAQGNAFGIAPAAGLLPYAGLGLLIALTGLQAAAGRLRAPVWTAKTLGILGLSLVLNAAVLLRIDDGALGLFYPALTLAQPALVGAAWLLLLPLDTALKRSILREAARVRASFGHLTVVAVCGSVGKTTTKELLAAALGSVFPAATPAYVNSELGVAQWFLQAHKERRIRPGGVVIVEMGGYRTGEVATLCRVMRPTVGIVTSVGTQHIALYGSKENILRAEREMPEALPPEGLLILNGDNPDCRALGAAARCTVVTVGVRPGNDVTATDIADTENGLRFSVDDRTVETPLRGTHNVTNALAAYVAAKAVGLDGGEIASALRIAEPPSRTFCVLRRSGIVTVDDTHNASPESVAAACAWAAARAERPRTLVTTGIIEQGPEEDAAMRRYGTLAAGAFERVVYAGARGKAAFDAGYGRPSEGPSPAPARVPQGGLLAAVGRVPPALIDSLLP